METGRTVSLDALRLLKSPEQLQALERDWRWLVGELQAAGAGSVRVSPDWEWVTFRPAASDPRVCQIVWFPVDAAFGVSRYDSRQGTCELLGDYPAPQEALRAALA
jgi:hypothetical protein